MPELRPTIAAALPVTVAVGVFGLSYGVLAAAAGVPGWQAVLMSATVFAGSAQFAAVSVFAAGGSTAAIVLSGALLNSRYLATGIAAARTLPGGRLPRFVLAQLIVDESYGLGAAAGEPARPDARTMIVSGVMLWIAWVGCSAAGAALGPVVGDPTQLGLDAAFPALFVALLWPLLSRPGAAKAAGAGAVVAMVLTPFAPPGIPLAAAAIAGLLVAR